MNYLRTTNESLYRYIYKKKTLVFSFTILDCSLCVKCVKNSKFLSILRIKVDTREIPSTCL